VRWQTYALASLEQLIHRRIDESGIDQSAITVGNDRSEWYSVA
jgi:hypothetical protein